MILGAALVFLILSLATFWWGTRPSVTGRRHVILVFAWLCAALASTLVVFSLFPDSQADGDVLGMTLGGAGAFVILVWTAALRATRQAERADRIEAQLRDRDKEIRRLRREVDALTARERPRPLESTQIYLYRVTGRGQIGIVTGDIRRTRCAEVWVNSENTDMRMARPQDHSVSGLIRYEGARRDDTGRIVADVIADELDARVRDRRPVAGGTVLVTGSGELHRIGVRWIAHVASVHGEPGGGFRPVQELGRCVTNVLDVVGGREIPARTVLFPLLGTGDGGADPGPTAETMVQAVVAYFAATPDTTIQSVYLLAYTDVELLRCRAALDAIAAVKPVKARALR